MPRTAMNSRRSRTSCSLIALATVLAVGATPARAQSFLGTGSIVTNTGGSANINNSVANTTTVTLNPGNTVIDWSPTNAAGTGNMLFQNSGTTATFNSSGNFAVLNNINAPVSRAVVMNGTVNGFVNGAQGGSVYFYAPGGFVFGGTSAFNVGSLVVSALPISNASFAGAGSTGFGTVTFGQAPNSNATISMAGTVNAFAAPPLGFPAPGGAGYVAMIAPRVVHTGAITVNGSAALVAAEAATINFSPDGLFDISVTVGSNPKDQDGNSLKPLEVYGDIGGPTPTGSGDKQGIYLVTVPKNDALTMVIGNGADLGFTLANTAVDDNGVIVLSAGHDIVDGAIGAKSVGHGASASANIWFTGARARNNVVGEATGYADIYSISPDQPSTIFDNDLTIHAIQDVSVSASGIGSSLTIAGNLSLSTDVTGTAGQSLTAGAIGVSALNGGLVSVTGSTSLSANATGGNASSGQAGNGTGGNIWVDADDGGTLTLAALTATAKGTGGNGLASGISAGTGTGGTIRLYSSDTSTVTINGATAFDTKGTGGNASGAGLAGAGLGGKAYVYVGTDSLLTINGTTSANSDGQGGTHASGAGGAGTGGEARVTAVAGSSSGGQINFNGKVSLTAEGTGGASAGGGTGGAGTGGWARISTPLAHDVVVVGGAALSASGTGGASSTGTGGIGQGGAAEIVGIAGNIDIAGVVDVGLTANGTGGSGSTGGAGFGGDITISSGSDVSLGVTSADASGFGGSSWSGSGGAGEGGDIIVQASGSDLALASLIANADGTGGYAAGFGHSSGDGQGGDIDIKSLANATLTISNDLTASAEGIGGQVGFRADGGDGRGGTIEMTATGPASVLHILGNTDLSVDGIAGFAIEATVGNLGGLGDGGDIDLGADGAGAWLDLDGSLTATADGFGGMGVDANAGNGVGGSVQFSAGNGARADVGQLAELSADGTGGAREEGGYGGDLTEAFAGDGQGGFVEAFTWGTGASDLNLLGGLDMHADGFGGNVFIDGLTTFAGSGNGGTAWLDAQVGTLDITGNAVVSATGEGGMATFGTGGDGTGKEALISGIGGAVTISGTALVDVGGLGGSGLIGGNGTGGGVYNSETAIGTNGAHIYARAGSVNIAGTATLSAAGQGGQGVDGLGGSVGTNGGAGGNGTGGWTTVLAANSNLAPSSITLSTLNISAGATGGAGGDGGNGNGGGNGGAGGAATGGVVQVHAHAGNGHVNITTVNANAIATGGQGGNGGSGDGLPGGNGGDGGNAEGGGVSVGTASGGGGATGSNLGTATYGSIVASASATGGDGGSGSFGSTNGAGGDGGTGDGGGATLLVRGSSVTVTGSTQLIADGSGGDGGSGGGESGPAGNGGDGFAGEINVLATSRFMIPAQQGTLNTGAITGSAVGSGGLGAVNGTGILEGGSSFVVDRSTVDIASLNFNVGGDTVDPGADASRIAITNADVDITGTFAFSTLGELSFYIDNASIDAATLTLTAGNFVADQELAAPVNRGTAFADTATITTGGDFIADADFNIGGNLSIAAPGLIDAHHFATAGNLLLSAAGGGIDVNTLSTTGSTTLLANGNIQTSTIGAGTSVYGRASGTFTAPNVNAGTFIDIRSGGALTLANLTAGDYIDLRSNSPILIQNASSGETINLQTLGTLTTGNLTAGNSVLGQAVGAISVATVSAGLVDPSTAEGAQYRASFASSGNIATGAVSAQGNIGFGTPGNLVTGNLNSGGGIMALVGGNISLPTVDADEYVFLANHSMSALGGTFETFDRDAVLAAEPVLTGGSIGISGPLTAGTFVTAAAGTNLGFVTIDAGGDVDLRAGNDITGGSIASTGGNLSLDALGAISVGVLSSGLDIDLDAIGNILFTSASAGSDFDFGTDGSISGGNVVASNEISGNAGGTVSLGNLTAGLPEEDNTSVGIAAVGNISVGNVSGASLVGFATQGNLLTGTVSAGDLFLAMVGGNVTTNAITTTGEAGGQVYIADDSMFVTGGGTWDGEGDFDPAVVLALDPVRTGGAITINGPVSTGLFRAAAGTTLTTGAINSGGGIGLDANGSITTGNLLAGNFVLANGGSITTGSINADSVAIESTGGNITVGGDIDADGDVELDAFGNILTDNIVAGTIDLAAGGSITTDNLTTQLPVLLAGGLTTQTVVFPDVDGNIKLIAGGDILTGNISAAQNILLATPGTITGQTIDAGGIFMALAHGDMSFGDATAAEVFLADFAMLIQGGGGLTATCVGNCGTLGPDGDVTAPPDGTTYFFVSTENGVSGAGQLPGVGGTNGSLYQTSVFTASAGDPLNFFFNYVTSDGSGFADYAWAALLTSSLEQVAILFTARTQPDGTIVPGQGLPGVEATLTPASVPIIDGATDWSALGGSSGACYGPGCGSTGWISSAYDIAVAGSYVLQFGVSNWSDTSLQTGMAFSGITVGGVPVGSALTPSGGSITIGHVDTGKMTAAAGTTLTALTIEASDFVELQSGGNMTTGAITAGGDLHAVAGGTMSLGALSADGDIDLEVSGNLSFVSANAGDDFDFDVGGSVNGGNVVAGDRLGGSAGGSVTLGNLTAGLPEGDDFGIGISAVGNITVQNASAQGNVGFATQGNLQTGNLSAGDVVLTMVGGNTTVNGTITTSGGLGQVYMGDDSMFTAAGGAFAGEDDFDPAAVLAINPVATGGSITINGAVSTNLFRAAAGQGFTAQGINANTGDIEVSAGGTATVNGAWSGSDIELASNDIDITSAGTLDASDILALFSTNATQALIGDGLTGTGYALSNAEFGRLEGGNVYILARGDASAAQDMLIGNLTVTGPSAGSTIESSEGSLVFAVGDFDSLDSEPTFGGVIRVNGNIAATGFGPGNAIEFHADRFELDAATGSVSITSSGGALAGELGLYADRIHVASATILNQLAANPTYTGYQQDLNQPAAVQRPQGVLRADRLYVDAEGLQSLLIQNTGTFATPAGFLVRDAEVPVEEAASPPGSINMVVNGQVQTEGGTLTGVQARDALVGPEDTGTAAFTSNSTINGCPLSGPCVTKPAEPPPSGNVVDDQIDLINDSPLGDGDFGNEADIDDGEEGGDDGASNPIAPPQPLFDTRPLTPGSEVNDPVSGTGNPALLGGECEEDENGQCPAQPADGDGQ